MSIEAKLHQLQAIQPWSRVQLLFCAHQIERRSLATIAHGMTELRNRRALHHAVEARGGKV
ncbi:hypothetical protein [Pseudomonas moorei]|uniref:hypothetical protein n=1 Tax=Pseudomonas moorei TaxID=395599 RepID=UPI001FF55956|nr:hypothetical protein [Pseudomonas moorei]